MAPNTVMEEQEGRPLGAEQEEALVVGGAPDLGVLGELRITVDGQVVDAGPRLQRCLLGILIVELDRVVPVDRLIDLLWGDEPPAAAIASVQAYVSQLRRILEPGRAARSPARILVTQDPGYVLRLAPEQVDAYRFLSLSRAGRELLAEGYADEAVVRLDRGLGEWRGEPFVEFASERWAVPMVARLTEAYDATTEDRIDAWLTLGRHSQAVPELEEMVKAKPFRERRWGQLILANYRSGSQAEALRAFQRCRTVLGEELGIETGPELRRLESAVVAQDPSLDWRPVAMGEGIRIWPPVSSHAEAAVAEHDQPAAIVRATHRERIRERLEQTAGSRGGVVVLVGEPGVGKTTLAEQATQTAVAAGAKVAWSRCPDAAAAPAYWPWIQVLRELPDTDDTRAALTRLLGEEHTEGLSDAAAASFRAYEALISSLRSVSAADPLVVVFDDIHAADTASLALLELVAGDLHRLPVLLVLTLRDTEPSDALDRTLGELLRHPGVERLAVTPLDEEGVATLAASTLGDPVDPTFTAALLDRTGGNVFYLTELLRLLGSEHRRRSLTADDVRNADVPSGVRDVILRRSAMLPDNTRALLPLAAVMGRDIDLELLENVADVESEELLLAMEPAVAAGLLVQTDVGWGYRFRHPLIQQSIEGGISMVDRARLHARVAAALEARPPADVASRYSQLAHHYLAAGRLGNPDKAVAYAREAAQSAIRQGAWIEAIRQLELALAAVPAGAPDGIRCDLLVELGRARRTASFVEGGHAALEEAISLADAIGDEDRVLNAAVAFGAISLWGSRDWGETDLALVSILERQLRRVGDDGRKVRILSTLAMELYFGDAAPIGWQYACQALDLARQLGGSAELGIAASSYLLSGQVNDRIRERQLVIDELLSNEIIELGRDVEAVLRMNLLSERLRYGDLAAYDAEHARVRDLAVNVLHSAELEVQLSFIDAGRDAIVGDLGKAHHAIEGFVRLAVLTSNWNQPGGFVRESAVLLHTGQLSEHADELLDRARHPEHPSLPHLAAPAAALGYAQAGRTDKALEVADEWFTPPPRSWSWIQAVAYWALVAVLVGAPDPQWLYDQLLPHSGELVEVGTGIGCGGATDSILAGLLLRLGRPEDALRLARAGLALERRAGFKFWVPRSEALVAEASSQV